MTTYNDISHATTSHSDSLAGFGILCNNTGIYCNSEDYYCDGAVVMRDMNYIEITEITFQGENISFQGRVTWQGAFDSYDDISYT